MNTRQSRRVFLRNSAERTDFLAELGALLSENFGITITGSLGSLTGGLVQDALSHLASQSTGHTSLELRHAVSHGALPPPKAVLYAESITAQDGALISHSERHLRRGGSFILASESDPISRSLIARFEASLPERFMHFHLEHLSDREIAQQIHEQLSGEPLDSVTLDTIVTLACGRPGWVADLVSLAHAGHLIPGSHPGISRRPLPPLSLPAIDHITTTLRGLTPEAVTAAVVLADLNPMTFSAASSLCTHHHVMQLLDHGVLTHDADSELLTAPPLIGAALRAIADEQRVAELGTSVAERLIAQEHLGFPLTGRDTKFCARMLSAGNLLESPNLRSYAPTLSKLLTSTLTERIQFGSPESCRSILFRFAELGSSITPTLKARTLIRSDHFVEAAEELQGAFAKSSEDERVGSLFLLSHISAELSVDLMNDSALGTNLSDTEAAVRELMVTLNTPASVPEVLRHSERLSAILDGHSNETVRDAFAMLHDLDRIWLGLAPHSSWISSGTELPAPALRWHSSMTGVVNSTLVGNAMTAFLAGELAPRKQEFERAFSLLPGVEHHRLWLTHLLHADAALRQSDLQTGVREWQLFAARVPHLIGKRLSEYIHAYGEALQSFTAPAGDPELETLLITLPVSRQVGYLAGRLDLLRRATLAEPRAKHEPSLVHLARTHLTASSSANPTQLLRAGETLLSRGMYALSHHAVSEAKQVFITRRAAGKVAQCDTLLNTIEAAANAAAPSAHQPTFTARTTERLTPRELQAARLAALGMTNQQIANELTVKLRTVESHIAKARAKLGAPTRRDLARLLPTQ